MNGNLFQAFAGKWLTISQVFHEGLRHVKKEVLER
jgi:hypothetical protein